LPFNDKEINLIVLTHNHADHLNGINEVLNHYTVDRVWISGAIHTTDAYKKFLEQIKAKRIPTEFVQAGSTISFGDLSGIVLFPLTDQTGQLPDNQHDADVVTYWTYGDQSLMLTGDAETEHEAAMLNRGVVRPATILKVGHHGSTTSTGQAFLDAVKPAYAIIQVGRNNKFGHPAPSTVERLQRLGATIFRTDLNGTILCNITTNATQCTPTTP
jgi:competence protein ComEC